MKIYLKNNVFDEALDRIRWVFDEFDHVYVSTSGGKDSDIVYQLAMMVAEEKGRLPLNVVWLDQEIEWGYTADHVKDLMYDDRVNPLWLQVPFLISNATSASNPFLDCWAPEKEEDWIRPKDPISIKENTFDEVRFHAMFTAIMKTWHPEESACYLAGVRCEESPTRYTALTASATYKGRTWGKVLDKKLGHYTFYPIYDWSYTDVWKAIYDHDWPYCKVYDFFYQYGIPIREMRVSNLNHETAVRSLFIAHEIDGHTWSRITKRLEGTNTAAVLKNDMISVPKTLPYMFDSWVEYRDYLTEKLFEDEEKRKKFAHRFKQMDERYRDMLSIDKMHGVQIKSLLANDYEFVLCDNWERSPNIKDLRNFWAGKPHPHNATNPYIDWSKFNADGSRIESNN